MRVVYRELRLYDVLAFLCGARQNGILHVKQISRMGKIHHFQLCDSNDEYDGGFWNKLRSSYRTAILHRAAVAGDIFVVAFCVGLVHWLGVAPNRKT